jgi:antitoxin (DNA-binding transcriptional repressor) of toxin-antitoxin stability system
MAQMSQHTIEQAEAILSALIDRAIAGEGVIITRDGKPVAELRALAVEGKPVTKEGIAWLDANRIGRVLPREDAVTLIRRMREDGEH